MPKTTTPIRAQIRYAPTTQQDMDLHAAFMAQPELAESTRLTREQALAQMRLGLEEVEKLAPAARSATYSMLAKRINESEQLEGWSRWTGPSLRKHLVGAPMSKSEQRADADYAYNKLAK